MDCGDVLFAKIEVIAKLPLRAEVDLTFAVVCVKHAVFQNSYLAN
jgi:hypothetical protein